MIFQDLPLILGRIQDKGLDISGLRDPAAALAACLSARQSGRSVLCVSAGEARARQLSEDMAIFTELPIFNYPGYEIPPYTPLSPDPYTTAQRLSTLYKIKTTSGPFLVTTSAEALLRRVMPAAILTSMTELLIAEEEIDLDNFIHTLNTAGYESSTLVQNAGEYSLRGDILDIFPPGFTYPVRLNFFGDFIETMRLFDPISQRSIEEINEAEIIPAHDVVFPADSEGQAAVNERITAYARQLTWATDELDALQEKTSQKLKFPGIEFFLPLFYDQLLEPLAYLPTDTIILLLDPPAPQQSAELVWERVTANHQAAVAEQTIVIPPADLFISPAELSEQFTTNKAHRLHDFETTVPGGQDGQALKINCGNHKLLKQHLELQRKKQGLLTPLVQQLKTWLDNGDIIHIACRSERRRGHLRQMLEGRGLPVTEHDTPLSLQAARETIHLYPTPLSAGFDLLDEQIHFISELELFGENRIAAPRKKSRIKETAPLNFEQLHIGDVVVHLDHGLGIYDGIINMKTGKTASDFMQISYKNNDRLYVPMERINTVSKYNGLSDKKPVITSLGSKAWNRAKAKVHEAVWQVADDLLKLYARRKQEKGIAFSPPDAMYQEFEESFPYDETSGQQKAINDVLRDQTSERCMDRLVCGDVGFGKTEVAARAAFKVVADGRQVAILVPTTVLAEQHTETFRERMAGFPVNIGSLNRFRTPAQQREIIQGLKDGGIDIVIGTHRLLSKDVEFKNLGLLIIDEEHRFGVRHKERLKSLRVGVDVLTLTATPIPRTLQMSLLGVRDLSIIQTPPRHRHSVKTFVAQYDDLVIKEAVIKELQRGGQVFIVHNRVHSIQEVAFKIQALVPEARIAVAHGQMPGNILEDIMFSFIHHEVDILICTTIIESGLDIPNANTIIITRADRMGLAGIYQLRGRVGRSRVQAYAYLLVPSMEQISKDAKQRLRALMEYNELGGGFKLAMSDLQIRGGGNILGESQSGNIAAVGYDLYLDLLQNTVNELKKKSAGLLDDTETAPEIDPEINLNISAFIPESYVPDTNQRYIAYRKIAAVKSATEARELEAELLDRYGKLPEETRNLIETVSLKDELRRLRITKLEQGPACFVFSFAKDTPVTPQHIIIFIKLQRGKSRLTPDNRLIVDTASASTEPLFERLKKILRAIW